MARTVTKEQVLAALQKINREHGRGKIIHVGTHPRKVIVSIPRRAPSGTESFRLETLTYRLVRRTVFFRGYQATIPAKGEA